MRGGGGGGGGLSGRLVNERTSLKGLKPPGEWGGREIHRFPRDITIGISRTGRLKIIYAKKTLCPLKTENLDQTLRKSVRCPHKTEVRLMQRVLY